MKVVPDDPVRWKDQGADRHALEDRAAILASAAGDVAPVSSTTLARIRNDVVAGRRPLPAPDLGWFAGTASRHLRFVAPAVVLLLLSAATAGGANRLWRRYFAPDAPQTTPVTAQLPAARAARATRAGARTPIEEPPSPPVADPAPALDPAPASNQGPALDPAPAIDPAPPAPVAVPAGSGERVRPVPRVHAPPRRTVALADAPGGGEPRSPSRVVAPSAAVEPAATGSPSPASESRLLAVALADLRQRRDPRAALADLEQYERAFPHGFFRSEATSARVEAVVQLRDWPTALALLDGMQTFPEPVGADLLLTRAELRAQADRCREALVDFSELLDGPSGWSRSPANPASERALYGRAVCLGRLRQDDRARADLEEYRRRFPRGHFAAEVERLLGPGGPATMAP
jgi:hypothetical protein